MSVRIHAIAKEIKKTSKQVLDILSERGYDLKSASSTIDNITAQSLIEEFIHSSEIEQPKKDSVGVESTIPKEEKKRLDNKVLPIVKSKEDLAREKMEHEEASLEKEFVELELSEENTEIKTKVESSPSHNSAAMAPAPPQNKRPLTPNSTDNSQKVEVGSVTSVEVKKLENSDTNGVVEGNLIIVKPPIVVRDFAGFINLKPFQLISELMEMGIFASMNQTIEEEVARRIAKIKGFELEIRHRGEKTEKVQKSKVVIDENDEKFLQARSPVVCILGHVDHGKTTLLDTIRQANVVSGEAGGITQHVGAYQILHNDQKITFLDTPGHAAFSKIRERGANLTDVAVLVVAADDGFMPQTDEALKFAQRAQGTLVVAINKMDVKGADADKVKTQMQERSIPCEDWGLSLIHI